MRFPEEASSEVITRLRRAEGQIRGVQRLIDEGADCKEVVHQLTAAQAALHRAGLRLMVAGMRHCLAESGSTEDEGAQGDGMDIDQMEQLFLSLR